MKIYLRLHGLNIVITTPLALPVGERGNHVGVSNHCPRLAPFGFANLVWKA